MKDVNAQADALWNLCCSLSKLLWETCTEIFKGIRDGTIPTVGIVLWGTAATYAALLWRPQIVNYPLLLSVATLSGLWGWALCRVCLMRRLKQKLRNIFTASGLKNALGDLPHLVFDRPLNGESRVMRVGRALLSIDKFKEAKSSLESGLRVYIDDVIDNRENGTVDIHYSLKPMPTLMRLSSIGDIGPDQIKIGMARSKTIVASLDEVPHLLVAGETSSGKSTFLRQAITTLYLNNKGHRFTAIDLKGGMEFSLFVNLDRVQVIDDLSGAIDALTQVERELDSRLKAFAAANTKDYPSWIRATKGDEASRGRLIVVIDEVAELFLPSSLATAKDLQPARAIVSRIARQGRAVGVHLILGTQRPDARALDTQIKANLIGKVCFQMADTTSSMVVLGNGRARELPGIPGRAIWQRGLNMTEVQTPFLDMPDAEKMLAPLSQEKSPSAAVKSVDEQRIVRVARE